MIINFENYIENLKEIIHQYIIIVNAELSLDLSEEIIAKITRLLNDIFKTFKIKNKENYFKVKKN